LNIDRAIDSILPSDDFGSSATAATNLGTVVNTLSVKGIIGQRNDSDWFSFKAGQSGTITISFTASDKLSPQWQFASTPSDVKINGTTATVTVIAGQTYTVGLSTGQTLGHYSLDLNLKAASKAVPQSSVVQVGQEVRISGTSGDDIVSLIVADVYRLTVNGVQYQLDSRAVNSIVFDGKGGSDTIEIHADRGSVMAMLRPGTLDINGSEYKIHTANVECAALYTNSALSRAVFYDSLGNDTLVASPTKAELRGPGYVNRVEGFSSVCTYASLGIDVAWLYDSPGNDTLSISPTDTTLSGRGFANRVRYFDEVHADSSAGGYDMATLYNSYGNMQLGVSGKKAELSYGPSTTNTTSASVVGFKRVRAITSGGNLIRPQTAAFDFLLDLIGRQT
jgi:hypothetical protein